MIWETPAIKNQDRNTAILKTHEKETSTNWELFMRLSFCLQINNRSEFSFGTFPDRNGWMKMKKNETEVSTVGGRIKYLRKQKNITQEKLAEVLHLENKASVSSYETNRRCLSGDLVVKLSEIFCTTTDYLLKGNDADEVFNKELQELGKKIKTQEGKKLAILQLQLILGIEKDIFIKDNDMRV